MSRRKQARPSRANLEEELVQGLLRNNPVGTPEDETQEENDTGSEGGESNNGGGCVVGVEAVGRVIDDVAAVDLTAARSNHDGGDEEDEQRDNDELPMEEDETDELVDEIEEHEDDEEGTRKQMRNRQDAENNNSFIGEAGPGCAGAGGATPTTAGSPGIVGSGGSSGVGVAGTGGAFPSAGTSHVTLEALQNTKVAVAQFAATALAGGADSEAALQDLALLQSTLYTLQHQQVFQLQLISQLQQQLSITHATGQPVTPSQQILNSSSSSSSTSIACGNPTIDTIPSIAPTTMNPETNTSKEASSSSPLIHAKSISSLTSPPSSRPPSHHRASSSPLLTTTCTLTQQERIIDDTSSTSPITLALPATSCMSLPSSVTMTNNSAEIGPNNDSPITQAVATPMSHQMHMCAISSSLASSIITNNDPMPLNEPNTLEMLQKRAQEVLDNASQGLLANNLADELAFRSGKGSRLSPYDSKSGGGGRGEPFFKHRCRYCGKVFGSDSALQIHIRSHTVRGNTTCNICYKTFACNSALEIHYRSHTKERPFKCSICDRGFSTKGNMKQHMLTHKIRDMPPHLFNDSKQSGQQQQQQQQQQSQELENSRSPMCMDESSLPPLPPPPPPPPPPIPPSSMESPMPVKRSPPESDLPAPKRPSMSSKHLCQVCNKNFSSSSALQIHMRTHTGDKPFRCTVCQKAFTTKGNLKVHMGTHMWTNGASRRGRRMSLDLPPLPITPKDSEFLQRRPDLFYPYLPAPFLNGVQQKLNEISVIQSNNGLPAHPVSAGKYAGLFGSLYGGGGFPLEKQPMAPSSNGPLSDGKSSLSAGSMLFQTTPSPSHSPGTPSSNTGNQNSASVPAWSGEALQQHHFERDVTDSRPETNSTPPSARIQPPSAPRGEGLAA